MQHKLPQRLAWKQKSPMWAPTCCAASSLPSAGDPESLGGEVHSAPPLPGWSAKTVNLVGITLQIAALPAETLDCLQWRTSAQDTFSMLMDSGLMLECQAFQRGVSRPSTYKPRSKKPVPRRGRGHPAARAKYQLSQHVGEVCITPSVCAPALVRWWLPPVMRKSAL